MVTNNSACDYFDSNAIRFYSENEVVLFRKTKKNTYTFVFIGLCNISEWLKNFEELLKEKNPNVILKAYGKANSLLNFKDEIAKIFDNDPSIITELEHFSNKTNCSKKYMLSDIVDVVKLEPIA